jgi:hypothetical protein
MILDIHVHPMVSWGDIKSYDREEEKLLDCMRRANIDKASATPLLQRKAGLASLPDEDEIRFVGDFAVRLVEKYPNKFYGMLWLNPRLPIGFLTDTLKRYVIDGSLTGVKLLCEINVAEREVEPLAAFMEKHGIPAMIHSWYSNLSTNPNEAKPRDVACLASKFPGLRIQMAHLRGARFRGVQDIKPHKNIWIDTSGSESEDGYMEYALQELGAERILYGSDYPGRDFSVSIARVTSLDAPKEVIDKILGLNAIEFLEGRRKDA